MAKPFAVQDFMVKKSVCFNKEMTAVTAIRILIDSKISGASVVDEDGKVIGMLTEKDLLPTILESSLSDTMGDLVADLMTSEVETVSPDTSIVTMAEKFIKSHYRRYPVVDTDGYLLGHISRKEVLWAIDKIAEEDKNYTLGMRFQQ